MMEFESLRSDLRSIRAVQSLGYVVSSTLSSFRVSGLPEAALGHRIEVATAKGTVSGEIVSVAQGSVLALPEGDLSGLVIGNPVTVLETDILSPDSSWLGRIIDPLGHPLDGRPLRHIAKQRRITERPPNAALRRALGGRLSTGIAVFDTLLPLVRGQRIGLFAGSGVGKSSLLGQFARGVSADVVVIALVGERGRELREFTTQVLGAAGMARSVVVTATSDQSPLLRRRSLLSAMTVAEHFRDQGLHVLLLVDSVTRFAQAHREVALASGESGSLRGYPPSTAHMLMALCERAGPGAAGMGDITAVFTVLVAGSDMEEPIADIIRGTLDGHVVLDRDIAERGRYPAINLLRSVSRSLPAAASATENALLAEMRRVLAAYERAEMMVQAGLYVAGSDPNVDRAIKVWPALDGFLGEMAPVGGIEASFKRLEALLEH